MVENDKQSQPRAADNPRPGVKESALTNGRPPHVEVRAISKSYDGAQALVDVTLAIARGEIHALVGENGAGKSTLGKVISGDVTQDRGELLVAGQTVHYRSPRDALAAGIARVHQEIAVARGLSVLENALLGVEPTWGGFVRRKTERARFRDLATQLGFDVDFNRPATELGIADQQKVEIMRALAREGELVILDEPTAALNSQEKARLHDIILALRERGVTFVYISHDLTEVLKIADRVSVLKDGKLVSTTDARTETVKSLVQRMLGRSLDAMFPEKPAPRRDAPVALRVDGLTRSGVLDEVSFSVRAGEIVGFAGLVGSGRTEVARAIFGADPVDRGRVEINGRLVTIRSPRQAVRCGIALLPESRKDQGLVLAESVQDNLTLPSLGDFTVGGFVRRRAEAGYAQELAQRLDIRASRLTIPVAALSGGNQQKVALGKWLGRRPSVLIADEPTRGVDVGARATIYEIIRDAADQGLAVLLISSELEEVMGLANRILVMHRGRLVRELPGHAAEDEILTAAFSGSEELGAA